MDSYSLSQCQPGSDLVFTHDTGLYLEGLTVLANVTKDPALGQL